MGATISYDTKYKISMDVEVECLTLQSAKPASHKKNGGGEKRSVKFDKTHHNQHSGSESESAGSSSESDDEHRERDKHSNRSDSDSDSGSGSGSDDELKRVTVKITPDIAGYIRSYVRGKEFMEILDELTEFDLEPYGYMKDTSLVFDSQTVSYDPENKCIESVGVWDYIPPKNSSKSKKKTTNNEYDMDGGRDSSSSSRNNKRKHQRDEDDGNRTLSEYKTKEDEVDSSNILNILRENFNVASKNNEFIIHETKTNMLMLNITSVDISKV